MKDKEGEKTDKNMSKGKAPEGKTIKDNNNKGWIKDNRSIPLIIFHYSAKGIFETRIACKNHFATTILPTKIGIQGRMEEENNDKRQKKKN